MAGKPKTRAKLAANRGETLSPKLNGDIAKLIGGHPPHTPYTDDEVRARLLEARDRSLDMALDLCRAQIHEHLAVWQGQFERAAAELARMDERAAAKGSGGTVHLIVNGLDISRLEFGSNTPKGGGAAA